MCKINIICLFLIFFITVANATDAAKPVNEKPRLISKFMKMFSFFRDKDIKIEFAPQKDGINDEKLLEASIIIKIQVDGIISIDDKVHTLASLEKELKRLVKENKDQQFTVDCDLKTKYSSLLPVIDLCTKIGVESAKLSFRQE